MDDKARIGVVGPCAAGKTALCVALNELGYEAKHIAQDHSYVQDMWKRVAHPDVLIFLSVSYEVAQRRRPMDWTPADYLDQLHRLENARQHADLIIDTDSKTLEAVLVQVIDFLERGDRR